MGRFSEPDIEWQNRELAERERAEEEHPEPDWLVDNLDEVWDAEARGYEISDDSDHLPAA